MRKLIYILFIQLHVVFAHAGIFNDKTERDRFIEEAVIALDKKYAHNLELELTGSTTAADYVVDIRNIKHRNAHTLVGLDLTALNTELANIKATYSNEGVAVYVLLSTAQPHLMTNATDGYTDNTYFDQYLNQAKSMTRDQWNSLPQTQFDRVYANYKTELARITREIIDRSQLGIQTKKGALLHLFDHVSISKSSPSSALSVKLIYTPVIALGQDLKASSMQSMLAYINERTSSFAFSNPSKLYDSPVESTNGVINPYVVILKAAFAQFMSDNFVADENNLSMDAKLVYYRQGASNINHVIQELNKPAANTNPNEFIKPVNGITYTVKDYAGIIAADPINFWDAFLKTSDINNGIGIKEINAGITKVNYYIIITSDKNKHDEKVATQLVLESSLNNANTILVGMHFRNSQSSGDLQVQYICRYSSQLATKITSLRSDNGYTWYRNNITGEIVLGKQLAYTQSDGGLPQATDWKPLGLSASVNSSGQIFYTQYVRYPIIDYVLRGIDKSFNALDEYMMENGEVVGSIILEGAVIGATGGASLLFTGGRILAYHTVTKISLEVTKGAAIAYAINVGLNMITTDFEMGDAGYNNDVLSKGVDVTGVITAGIEEIYRDESSKALINCAGGITSASLQDNVRFLDLPEGCLRNVTTYYLTARLFGSGGASKIVYDKMKLAYAKNPIRFISRLKGYFNFTNDQVKTLLTKLGISNDGVVDNLGKLVLAAGRQYSKEALFIITKASTITNEVIGGSWKFYTTTSKNKVFAEINTNGDLIIKEFSSANYTGSTSNIVRSANYTNPAGQIETSDIAFLTNSNGTSGITKKVPQLLDDAFLNSVKSFDDNVLDVTSVGLQNWKIFQNRVAQQLQNIYPGKKIGSQITLDVTYTLPDGSILTKTIIPDNLIQIEVNGVTKYKVIDAKTSQTDLVNKPDLTSTCTPNQQPIYKMIDGDATAGTITKVEMRGGQAEQAFGDLGSTGKLQIQLEPNVEFWVNSSTTDFTQYLIRPRIK